MNYINYTQGMQCASVIKKLLFLAISLCLLANIAYGGITDKPQEYEADKEVTINFKGLKISDLIDITSKLLNRNILLTKKIGGTVDFIANRPLTQSDALDILMYTLETKGYTIVDSGNMLRVVKISDASKYNLPIQKDDVKYPKQELVTQMFSVENANVDYIASKVRHFMSRSAKLVTDKETNSMILTDFASNIKTVQIAIAALSSDNKKIIKIVPLKNVKAQSLESELNKVAKAVFNTKIGKEKVTILANKDTNSMMFVGNLKNVNYMFEYLMKIEKGGSLAKKVVEIIYLKNGSAANVFKVIGGIIGNKKYKNPDDKPFVSLDDETNSIIVRGPKSEVIFIKSMISDLDIDKQQVYVKVKIIEVSEKKSREVGIKYGLIGGKTTSSGLGTLSANLGGSAVAVDPSRLGISISSGLTEGLALGTTLNLLQTNGAAELLSSPLLLCINNKESSIYAGSTKTIKTGSTQSSGGTASDKFAREDIGLTLKIKPRISTGNKVSLDISLVLEDVETSTTNGQPDTSKKEVITTAIVNDGENVILGGYTREKEDQTITKVPFLGDIPLLGALFRSKKIVSDKINLVVIITPYIVPKTKDLTFIRNKLAKLKLLEDRYTQITLLRLEQQRLRNQELELDTKDEMLDVADDLLDNSEDIRAIDDDLQEYLDDMEGYDSKDKYNIAVMFGIKTDAYGEQIATQTITQTPSPAVPKEPQTPLNQRLLKAEQEYDIFSQTPPNNIIDDLDNNVPEIINNQSYFSGLEDDNIEVQNATSEQEQTKGLIQAIQDAQLTFNETLSGNASPIQELNDSNIVNTQVVPFSQELNDPNIVNTQLEPIAKEPNDPSKLKTQVVPFTQKQTPPNTTPQNQTPNTAVFLPKDTIPNNLPKASVDLQTNQTPNNVVPEKVLNSQPNKTLNNNPNESNQNLINKIVNGNNANKTPQKNQTPNTNTTP
jgi:general secretion pathway protein D